MRQTKRVLRISFVVSMLALPVYAGDPNETPQVVAPDFSLQNQDGHGVQLADYKGRVIVLEWTNPECPFVRQHYKEETMNLPKLAWKYQHKGVVWLAIHSSAYSTVKDNKAWHTKHKLSYPVIDDQAGEVGKLYQVNNTPHVCIIRPDGIVAYSGAVDRPATPKKPDGIDYISLALEAILQGKDLPITKTQAYGSPIKYRKIDSD